MRILCQPFNSLFLINKFGLTLKSGRKKAKTIRKSGQLQTNRGSRKPRPGRQCALSWIPDTVWIFGQWGAINEKRTLAASGRQPKSYY